MKIYISSVKVNIQANKEYLDTRMLMLQYKNTKKENL